ncbi:MAG: 50S ribosomal protein L15 [Magnetococcales bacterium]|nr:50S ribosomal protein L15 [Magnetococcales bacterium]
MRLNQLQPVPGSRQDPKRKGRGTGSGNGKTAGRGTKGQRARSGGFHKIGFEGGQMPMQRRLPKGGFKNHFRKEFSVLSLQDLEASDIAAGTEVTLELLKQKGLLRKGQFDGVKLLANGELTRAMVIHVDRCSVSAQAKVEAAGGRVVVPEVTFCGDA